MIIFLIIFTLLALPISQPATPQETCGWSSGEWTVTKTERETTPYNVCYATHYERKLRQWTCKKGGQITKQENRITSDWRRTGQTGC